MKILVDMNLSPRWVSALRAQGMESVHWRDVGIANAPDEEVLAWCIAHGYVLFTHDLDFGAVLAASQGCVPSVLQLRAQNPLPEAMLQHVTDAVRRAEKDLELGALVTIEPARHRVRLLPLNPG